MFHRLGLRYSSTAATSAATTTSQALKQAANNSKLSLSSSKLIHHPELWSGLPIDTVIKLYRSRVITLGKNYKRSETELNSLLKCSTNPLETQIIYNIYNSSEGDIYKLDSDEIDYDQYVGEGMYMEDPLEPYGFDEYPTSAQDIVHDFRDLMEFNRKAAFELPQLSKFRKNYNPESINNKPIKIKFTKFLGESHPGERKVVMEFYLKDLNLSKSQQHKFKLLSGSRYDFKTDIFKISCDKFNNQSQNLTYLNSILNNLITESAKNPENLLDLPLDKRHTVSKYAKKQRKLKQFIPFPKEWEKPITTKQRTVSIKELI